ncbi:MAG: hypothetical protein NUV77_12760, partial [Thermoguttaceae bacterium]|nr:hypothetical protein [Thermoguttaceae bacterium]
MNTTARILRGLSAVVLALWAVPLWAEPAPHDPNSVFDRAGVGPSAGSRSGDKRLQADDLLRRARQAMEQNDLDAAGQLVRQAEALNVEYHPLYTGDTPAKVRRELDRRMQAGGQPGARSGLFGAGRSTAPADPFAAYPPADPTRGDPKSTAKSYLLKARTELRQGNLEG